MTPALGFAPHVYSLRAISAGHTVIQSLAVVLYSNGVDAGISARPVQTCTLEPSWHVLMGPALFPCCSTNFRATEKH